MSDSVCGTGILITEYPMAEAVKDKCQTYTYRLILRHDQIIV